MDKIDRLVKWATAHGATLHKDVAVYDDEQYGVCLRSRAAIRAHDQIVSTPFSLSLSYLNTLEAFASLPSHPNFSPFGVAGFPDQLAQRTDVHVIGHFFLILQYLLGGDSFWHPYIEALPQPHEPEKLATPLFYTDDAKAYLASTQVGSSLVQGEARWREEWSAGRTVLDNSEEWASLKGRWSWELYKWAATIFSSRSFISSLIPQEVFQDALHPNADTLFTSPGARNRSASTLKAGILPVLFPLVDLANHNPASRVTWFSNVQTEPMDLGLLTEADLAKDQQIFNNYAPKGNSQLYLGYGFLLPGNDDLSIAPKKLEGNLKELHEAWLTSKPGDSTGTLTTYTVRLRPFPFEEDNRLPAFSRFENGCIDHLVLLTANERELASLKPYSDQRPETNAKLLLQGYMGRSILAVASTLREMLQIMLDRLLESSKGLRNPTTSSQIMADEYRKGQIELLESTISPLTELLQSTMSPSPTTTRTTLLSLPTAFTPPFFPKRRNQKLQGTMITSIRKTLDIAPEEVIQWQELEEDWGFTLWCFWVFGQLLDVWRTEAEPGRSWISNIHAEGVYGDTKGIEDGFCGEVSEWEVFEEMVGGSDIERLGWAELGDGEKLGLMLEAGRIVMGESVLMRGAWEGEEGSVFDGQLATNEMRRMLCLYKTEG